MSDERKAPYAVGGKARALHWDPARGTCLGDLEVTRVVRLDDINGRAPRWAVTLRIDGEHTKVATVDRWGRDVHGNVYPPTAITGG